MREYEGWYFKKEKTWTFPIGKYQKVYDALKDAGYIVNTEVEKSKSPRHDRTVRKISKEESFKNPDVVAVFGVCDNCGLDNFVGRDGLCSKCRSEK